MIPQLQSNKKFIDDYKNYQKRINEVTDPNLQRKMTDLLLQLKEQVSYIDRSHQQMFVTGRISTEISELRANLITIKKDLDQKLHDWDKSKFRPAPLPSVE
jgi:hypothetical protein